MAAPADQGRSFEIYIYIKRRKFTLQASQKENLFVFLKAVHKGIAQKFSYKFSLC